MLANDTVKLPEVMFFAGPNGSGKTTITKMVKIVGQYVNADDIKKTTLCSDMEAAIKAEELREKLIAERKDFTFETVLSTDRNLKLLKKAKEQGYFIRGIYVLTVDVDINISRVDAREALGGHSVPEDKIRSRYEKALKLIPELVKVCDILHIYDNSGQPIRIFKKRKDLFFIWPNQFWSKESIEGLTGVYNYTVQNNDTNLLKENTESFYQYQTTQSMDMQTNLIQLKESTGLNWHQFADYFGIPYRTMQDWYLGKRKMPDYLLRLMNYKIGLEKPVVK